VSVLGWVVPSIEEEMSCICHKTQVSVLPMCLTSISKFFFAFMRRYYEMVYEALYEMVYEVLYKMVSGALYFKWFIGHYIKRIIIYLLLFLPFISNISATESLAAFLAAESLSKQLTVTDSTIERAMRVAEVRQQTFNAHFQHQLNKGAATFIQQYSY